LYWNFQEELQGVDGFEPLDFFRHIPRGWAGWQVPLVKDSSLRADYSLQWDHIAMLPVADAHTFQKNP
jgi:hypothetical protein